MAINKTLIQIDWPKPPKISDRPEKQDEFERWLFDYNTCIMRQFEELAEVIDTKQSANQS